MRAFKTMTAELCTLLQQLLLPHVPSLILMTRRPQGTGGTLPRSRIPQSSSFLHKSICCFDRTFTETVPGTFAKCSILPTLTDSFNKY